MIHLTHLQNVFLIKPQIFSDHRGFFARIFCQNEFQKMGLHTHFEQCSVSFNHIAGTLRGMHFQIPPFQEIKLVRCTRGKIFDILVDLRPDSPTFMHWEGHILSEENHHMLYVPKGVAHGFQTLVNNTEVFYQISISHAPSHASGVRWNDPAFSISWPMEISAISEKDQNFPDFNPLNFFFSSATFEKTDPPHHNKKPYTQTSKERKKNS